MRFRVHPSFSIVRKVMFLALCLCLALATKVELLEIGKLVKIEELEITSTTYQNKHFTSFIRSLNPLNPVLESTMFEGLKTSEDKDLSFVELDLSKLVFTRTRAQELSQRLGFKSDFFLSLLVRIAFQLSTKVVSDVAEEPSLRIDPLEVFLIIMMGLIPQSNILETQDTKLKTPLRLLMQDWQVFRQKSVLAQVGDSSRKTYLVSHMDGVVIKVSTNKDSFTLLDICGDMEPEKHLLDYLSSRYHIRLFFDDFMSIKITEKKQFDSEEFKEVLFRPFSTIWSNPTIGLNQCICLGFIPLRSNYHPGYFKGIGYEITILRLAQIFLSKYEGLEDFDDMVDVLEPKFKYFLPDSGVVCMEEKDLGCLPKNSFLLAKHEDTHNKMLYLFLVPGDPVNVRLGAISEILNYTAPIRLSPSIKGTGLHLMTQTMIKLAIEEKIKNLKKRKVQYTNLLYIAMRSQRDGNLRWMEKELPNLYRECLIKLTLDGILPKEAIRVPTSPFVVIEPEIIIGITSKDELIKAPGVGFFTNEDEFVMLT